MLEIIILAAGQGKRMNSSRPKVLHTIGGKPMVLHVLDTARSLSPERIHVIYGQGGDNVQTIVHDNSINWCHQSKQLGTGHAVQQVISEINPDSKVLVLYADVPLLRTGTLEQLLKGLDDSTISILSVCLSDPTGYGRLVRNTQGEVECIIEEKDANEDTRHINEVNTGILATRAADLGPWLDSLDNDNAQGEYYLTDCIAHCVDEGGKIHVQISEQPAEVMGVNDKLQLAKTERAWQQHCAEKLMQQGVTLADPARLDVRGEVIVGRDVAIDINVILEGTVQIEDDVSVGAHCILKNVQIGSGCEIGAYTRIEDAIIGKRCVVGPYARIRPETRLANDVHIGNFVEIKKSYIDEQSKVNHLSYIGDSKIGKRVNVGAGTITCNYDGACKHVTHVGDDVFIGSSTQLIAPVNIAQGSTIGAGSTITHDTPANELTLSRVKQVTVHGWKRPQKK